MDIDKYPKLKSQLCDAFNTYDLQGLIALGAPPDEYDSEIREFMLHVSEINSIASSKRVLYNAFIKYFDQRIAGTIDVYEPLAVVLFNLLRNEGLITL